mgnify:CR=1 FL=1
MINNISEKTRIFYINFDVFSIEFFTNFAIKFALVFQRSVHRHAMRFGLQYHGMYPRTLWLTLKLDAL